MRKSDLLALLYSMDEEEVLIEEDEVLYEIEVSAVEESFDGFDTVYPGAVVLKAKKK